MRIKNISLQHFRNFQNYSIDFHDNLTVLVADNGAGKTALLDIISIAFGSYVGTFPLGKQKGFKAADASIVSNGNEPLYPISLKADIEIDSNIFTINRMLSKKGSSTTSINTKPLQEYAKSNYQKLINNQNVDLPIVAYYGTGRLWKKIKITTKFSKENHVRSYGYNNCLDPASSYKDFEKWFIENSRMEYDSIIKKVQSGEILDSSKLMTKNSTTLKNVRESINLALKPVKWNNLRYNSSELVLENEKGINISVDMLSDGIKNILALIADIAYRCSNLNPHFDKASSKTKGVVLIDEVDMHLHPSWQQKILKDLTTIFPKIQFIVTTHSPQVLSSIKKDNIRIIKPDQNKAIIPNTNPYGKQSIVALEDIMDVDATPPKEVVEETEILKEYLNIITSGNIDNPKLQDMRTQLDEIYGSNYNKLLIADMIINKFKAKSK